MNQTGIFASALRDIGLKKGDAVMVHASLGSLGEVARKDQLMVDALLRVIGGEGTLLMPALSYQTVTPVHPDFHLHITPSCVGWLAEYFRKLPETKRSVHPTHSVCATGKNVEYFLGEHAMDHTPCGPHSPFSKLRDAGGVILFLGCGLKPNTSMHGIEELSQPPYLFDEKIEYTIDTGEGESYKKHYIPHDFKGVEQRYDRVTDVLDASDYSFGKVGEADTYLLKTGPLWEKALAKLLVDPYYFVDRTDNGAEH